MIPQDQEHPWDNPEKGVYGDCIRAALASLLSLPIAKVPHFIRETKGNHEAAGNALHQFLAKQGYCALEFPFLTMSIQLKQQHEKYKVDIYHLITGIDPEGDGHACVGLNGEIIHDPHPLRRGFNNPPEEWRIILMGSLNPGAQNEKSPHAYLSHRTLVAAKFGISRKHQGAEFPRASVAASNPREAGSETHAQEGLNANNKKHLVVSQNKLLE